MPPLPVHAIAPRSTHAPLCASQASVQMMLPISNSFEEDHPNHVITSLAPYHWATPGRPHDTCQQPNPPVDLHPPPSSHHMSVGSTLPEPSTSGDPPSMTLIFLVGSPSHNPTHLSPSLAANPSPPCTTSLPPTWLLG
ncbi:hypothetical protein AMTRI_Chr09g34190 [Amborella trichopoda]